VRFRKNKPRTFFDGYSHIVDKAQGNLTSFALCRFPNFSASFLVVFNFPAARMMDPGL
jgi:hypothetical protein